MRGPRTVMKSGPHLPQLEKALAQKRRRNTVIKKLKKKKIKKKKTWINNGCPSIAISVIYFKNKYSFMFYIKDMFLINSLLFPYTLIYSYIFLL